MDVSVRELRNHTARVIAAVESGEPVALTKYGRPVADITPRAQRSETRPLDVVFAELRATQARFRAQGLVSSSSADAADDGWTSDDLVDEVEANYR
jgi:prevent-host-death family protein